MVFRCLANHKFPCPVATRSVAAGTLAVCLVFLTGAHAGGQATQLRLQHCFEEISKANQAYTDGRADIANERLQQLTHSCSGVAHLYHNLGAIAALRRDWDQAIIYLEQSLALDRRAAMTQAGLSGIYQYKAALAYRKALDLSGPSPKPPSIMLQTGDLGNGPVAPHVAVKALATVTDTHTRQPARSPEANNIRFTVADWWAARRKYAPELPSWSAIDYATDPLDNNLSMVWLNFKKQQILLVLQKKQDQWNIIREKHL